MSRRVALAIGSCAFILTALLIRPGPVVRWLARRYPEVLFYLETEEPLVALTIDDAPHPTVTPQILDALAEHDAHATFFVIGEYIPGNEAIVRRMVAEGHELGNHLMSDVPSVRLPAAEFERQLLQTHEALAPYGPARWCRPGHGWFNRRMLGQLHRHGYRCAMASAYSLEFRATSARYAARHILLNARPGAVIVLHDGDGAGRQTLAVLRRVLPELRHRGYRVVTLSELAVENEDQRMAAADHEQVVAPGDSAVIRGKPRLDFNPLFRSGILAATSNPLVSRTVQRYGMRLGAARFVAGETFDEAIPVLRGLNQKSLRTNTALLGEGVKEEATTRAVVAEYLTDLDRIAAEGLQTNIALKLTHLGLDLDPELAYRNVAEVVAHAAGLGNFIRIDMEESARVDDTLRIYRRLRADGHDNVGTVLQSYLYRTPDDMESLLSLSPNLRLVKGAYLEPPHLAYPRKADVDRAYVALAERMLTAGGFTAIATHDERIIDHVIDFTQRHGIGPDRFEFQMLYGVRPQYQVDLARAGHRVLIATPYGPHWYLYLMRRLAERPANLMWFAANVVKR